MKLLTHNMLTSHVKGVTNGYPLRILVSSSGRSWGEKFACVHVYGSARIQQATKVQVKNIDFNGFFIARIIPRLEWSVLKQAADLVVFFSFRNGSYLCIVTH